MSVLAKISGFLSEFIQVRLEQAPPSLNLAITLLPPHSNFKLCMHLYCISYACALYKPHLQHHHPGIHIRQHFSDRLLEALPGAQPVELAAHKQRWQVQVVDLGQGDHCRTTAARSERQGGVSDVTEPGEASRQVNQKQVQKQAA